MLLDNGGKGTLLDPPFHTRAGSEELAWCGRVGLIDTSDTLTQFVRFPQAFRERGGMLRSEQRKEFSPNSVGKEWCGNLQKDSVQVSPLPPTGACDVPTCSAWNRFKYSVVLYVRATPNRPHPRLTACVRSQQLLLNLRYLLSSASPFSALY